MSDWQLYRRWVLANGWSECLGLGATGVLGWWIMRLTGEPASVVAVLGTALLGVTGGVLFEGILVGYAQARVLRARIRRPAPRASRWILANALAWMVGMPLVFLGAGAVPLGTSAVVAITILGLTCLTAGIGVGAVHGLFLIRLLADAPPLGPASHRHDRLKELRHAV